MENYNEIMNEEKDMDMEFDAEVIDMEDKHSGMGTLVAMAIGAGLTVATGKAVKFGKKLWNKHKTKKEQLKSNEDKGESAESTDKEIGESTK